jgi:hypothetical protein
MRYLLVLGFACDVYRKEPRARIFVGDQLIDEFYISHHKDTLSTVKEFRQWNNHILQPVFNELDPNIKIKNFPPLRFYEIDIEQTQNQLELRINIHNDDSNYNNGFITKSTLLQLQVCNFFPLNKKLLSRLVKIRKKNFINKNYAWFCSTSNIIFNLNQNGMEWRGENMQTFNTTNAQYDFALMSIGGNGHFYCKLVKKYGIFISKLCRSYRFNLWRTPVIDYFINKYKQHENKRNTD